MDLQSRHDVIATIADATGLSDLRPNAHDNFELVIGEVYSCFFHCADDDTLVLEMAVRIERLDGQTDAEVLKQMLKANTVSDVGRFALEPGTGRAFWSQRLLVVEHSRDSLVSAIKEFLRCGVDLDATIDSMMDSAAKARAMQGTDVTNDTMIRL